MEKVMKSIRLLLLFSLLQLGLSSCILGAGKSLVLKQSCFYFLLALLSISGICAFTQYLSSSHPKETTPLYHNRFIFLFYSIMVIVNLLGVRIFLSESITTTTLLQGKIVELLLPSFFFLLGIDVVTFLPLNRLDNLTKICQNRKVHMGLILIAILIFLRNPITILSIAFYVGLGALFVHVLFPKKIRTEISFYGHLIRDTLFVICIFLLW